MWTAGEDRRPEFIESDFLIARWQEAVGAERRNVRHDEMASIHTVAPLNINVKQYDEVYYAT